MTFFSPSRIFRTSSALLLVAMMGTAARAQFNGPSLGATADVNRPLTPTTDPAILYPAARELRLSPGDVLSVHVYGAPDYTPTARVTIDGSVQLPLIGIVPATGLTVHELQDRIAQRLVAAGMYLNPQVEIQVTESPNQVATISGELHAVVPLLGQRRLFDVLATAGGLPPTASHVITIHRPGVDQPIVVDLGTDPMRSEQSNIPIFPLDTIIVSRIGVVYVLGAFKNQGAFPIQQNSPLTLLQVASIAGGPGFEGKFSDLRIIRTTGITRSVVQVNIKKVMQGKAPDPVLQADDIVLLPTDAMKGAIKSGGIQTVLALASLFIYLHATTSQ
jgi:polysaccharide biosynthesis/export protein